ncbi:translocation complex subunit Sss1 [Camillea tinctor]|nr:translocation complex subunit Sss1 [Camillea tinctor]
MSEQIQEFFDVQKDFIKDGTQFMNRCTKPDKREFIQICKPAPTMARAITIAPSYHQPVSSKAVGVGFIVMGAVGYFVKLSISHTWYAPIQSQSQDACSLFAPRDFDTNIIAVNNVLVGGA